MNIDIKEIIKSTEYDFLRTDENLKDNLLFLTVGGSHAYGLNVENSDIDLRGCCATPINTLLGLEDFTEYVCVDTDTTIYSVNKLIKLLLSCNPNVIEIGYVKPEHRLIINPIANDIFDNMDLFLTKQAIHSFGNYALAQFNRALNSMARDSYTEQEKEQHIMRSVQSAMSSFNQRYTNMPEGSFNLYIEQSDNNEIDYEMFLDVNLKKYPLRDYKNQISEMNEIIKTYGKVNHRNKKPIEKLDKHLCHLFRLYILGIKILSKTLKSVYMIGKEQEFLMKLRSGYFVTRKEDGSCDYSFIYDLLKPYQDEFKYASENTILPDKVDNKKINDLLIGMNKKILRI